MTDVKARLEEIKEYRRLYNLHIVQNKALELSDYETYTKLCDQYQGLDITGYIIDQLEQSLALNARYREALEHYAQDEYVLSGSDYQCAGTSSYREAYVDDGGEIAREALSQSSEAKDV